MGDRLEWEKSVDMGKGGYVTGWRRGESREGFRSLDTGCRLCTLGTAGANTYRGTVTDSVHGPWDGRYGQ